MEECEHSNGGTARQSHKITFLNILCVKVEAKLDLLVNFVCGKFADLCLDFGANFGLFLYCQLQVVDMKLLR